MSLHEQEEEDVCRVCRCGATMDRVLYHPCMCRGSIRYVHQDCLAQWIDTTKQTHCQLCNHPFAYDDILHPHAPETLSKYELAVWAATRLAPKAGRAMVVMVVWVLAVPIAVFATFAKLWNNRIPDMDVSVKGISISIRNGTFVLSTVIVASILLFMLREFIRYVYRQGMHITR